MSTCAVLAAEKQRIVRRISNAFVPRGHLRSKITAEVCLCEAYGPIALNMLHLLIFPPTCSSCSQIRGSEKRQAAQEQIP